MSAGPLAFARSPLGNRSGAAVFLGYHSVADDGPEWLSVPVETFERQLALLARRGYRAGAHRDLAELAAGHTPDHPLAFLTFDDGFADNATVVMPLLRAYGWTALVFPMPAALDAGSPFDWPEVRARRTAHPDVMRSLDWAAAEEMADAGFEFGSHTNHHRRLPELGDEELRQDLSDSRRRIAGRLGSCDSLAYPFGAWDARVASAAADAGYRWAFTAPAGAQRIATPLSIPRIPVDHRDDERRFALKLTAPGRTLLLSQVRPWARALRHGASGLAGRRP
jgi:peptidoglycan/xylan/chitin deacetylase (PgdA/CDA1 family)